MVLEYLSKPVIYWTGMDVIQVGATVIVVILAYALVRAIILAGKAKEDTSKPP